MRSRGYKETMGGVVEGGGEYQSSKLIKWYMYSLLQREGTHENESWGEDMCSQIPGHDRTFT